MRLLERYPFARREVPQRVAEVMAWWESRRLAYNGIVGATGLLTIAILAFSAMLRGDDCGMPPPVVVLFAIVGYAVMANVCYTIGELVELAARVILGRDGASQLARIAFFAGVMLSIALTIAPAVILPLLCLARRAA